MARRAKPTALKDSSGAIMGYEAKLCEAANALRGSMDVDEKLNQGHAPTLGRYVAAEPRQDESQPFPEMMARLAARLREQQAEGAGPDAVMSKNPEQLGFGDRQ